MILKTKDGLLGANECPKCGYLILQGDMVYKNEVAVICKFCERQAERDRVCISSVELPVVIEWERTPEELADTWRLSIVPVTSDWVRNILISMIRKDRETATVKVSCDREGKVK